MHSTSTNLAFPRRSAKGPVAESASLVYIQDNDIKPYQYSSQKNPSYPSPNRVSQHLSSI